MRTPEQLVDDVISMHTDDPTGTEWQARRKLMLVAVLEDRMDRDRDRDGDREAQPHVGSAREA